MGRRKLFVALVAIVLLLIFSNWSALGMSATRVADKLLLYVRVARLYTREPDKRLSMPVKDVPKKAIANTWQAPRGVDRKHEGQDIFAPRGTPVLSATNGYVANIGENPLGGQTVSVVGDGGRVYYYAHLESYAPHLAEGDHVTRETVLGFVGTSGNALGTPPHLHFGVYTSGGAINPLPLLADRTDPRKLTREQKSKSAARGTNARVGRINS
ncbi:MAG: M23 family metallopeptidase [Pyrinomonadaceae bacterium]